MSFYKSESFPHNEEVGNYLASRSRSSLDISRGHDAYISRYEEDRPRVFLRQVLREPLVDLLFYLSLFVSQDKHMSWYCVVALLAVLAGTEQATTGCKNCVILGKEEKAMFRSHSDACLPSSRVDPRLVDAMLDGQLTDEPALRSHVYCILLKCKVIGKDGKLLKAALLGKMAAGHDMHNVTKILENCAEQSGNNPEDIAWNIFRCGYNKKAVLFDYMPTGGASSGQGAILQ